jgi:hypothetical protein
MKWIKKLPMVLAALLLVALLGCQALLNVVTPCHISQMTIDYAEAEPTSYMPWTTLFDSERIQGLARWKFQKEQLKYGFIKELLVINQFAAKELQTKVIQPAITGIVGSGALAFGWLGMSKPSDKKKIIEEEAKKVT